MTSARTATQGATLARLGFADPGRAERLLADPALAGLVDPLDDVFSDGLPDALGLVADPDLGLLSLVRLLESLRRAPSDRDTGSEDSSDTAQLIAALRHPGRARDRMLAVLGASTTLADHLVAHPEQWRSVTEASPRTVEQRVEHLVAAVSPGLADGAVGSVPAYAEGTVGSVRPNAEGAVGSAFPPLDALRVAYRQELLGIAALDLTAGDPAAALPDTTRALADLAQAALEAALAIARMEVGEEATRCRLAVIGMGKTGGRELNYVSDVDVIFVAEPAGDATESEAAGVGARLATVLMRACSASTANGTLWPVDAALRPEGKSGPLVRSVESHRAYYQRWAKTWEFQALLKARHVAGDAAVGRAYLDAVQPLVWQAASRDNFVADVQAMRRRVEQHVPAAEAGRQLKLGPGGLRDVEFSVQLLQLVHGRSDDSLRSGTTLEALAALARGGYVGRDDAATLDTAYRLLRTLEHRIQLYRLRRTHLMPTDEADLRRLGRAVGFRGEASTAVVRRWQREAREVRRLHERLFYRPLLGAVAKLSSSDARLTPDAARERLAALGFHDPAGALRHLEALTVGVSRRAAIQKTLLPVMLGWFADEADPDAGLLAFRQISDELGSTHWYLRLLRDEGTAAEQLAHVLARSRYAADLLVGAAESVQILGDASGISPRSRPAVRRRMQAAAGRKADPEPAMATAKQIRRQELFRISVADLLGQLDLAKVGAALTDVMASLVETALAVATRTVEERHGGPLGTSLLIVGMGRFGGGELGYASDADVMFVHDPQPSSGAALAEDEAQRRAAEVVQEVRRLLALPGADGQVSLDADLRPEGKNGPLVRSLDSYRTYYERWSLTWESQALLRAAPVAGDPGLAARFTALVDPLRWPDGGLSPEQVREVRRLKARMESERLPRGANPRNHFKLGRGGLTDVEWTVQLIQMRHAQSVPALRTTATLPAVDAAVAAGLLPESDGAALREAWIMASRMRNAAVLFRGRPVESLPGDLRDADGIGRIMGFEPGSGQLLADRYLRVARRSRAAVMANFYDAT